jgi:hypothetical protein
MAKLYSPTLEDPSYFYAQDNDGIPIGPIISDRPPLLRDTNMFDRRDFEVPRPDNFVGTWPPRTRGDLLRGRNRRPKQDRDWDDPWLQVWTDSIDIRWDDDTGYSLFARTDIPGNTRLGQYAGVLYPRKENFPIEQTEYIYEIGIGELQDDKTGNRGSNRARKGGKKAEEDSEGGQAICWIDAKKWGSFLRFAAHSCEPNTFMDERQNKGEERVIAACTLRDIGAGEGITIDYGKKWFKGDQRCKCRSTTCRAPFPFPRRSERIKRQAQMQTKDY